MQKLDLEQAIVLTGFTGISCVENFGDFHSDVEKRMGRPVQTIEFVSSAEEIKELYRDDFRKLVLGDC